MKSNIANTNNRLTPKTTCFRKTASQFITLLAILAAGNSIARAGLVTLDWATTQSVTAGSVDSPADALGKPDGLFAGVGNATTNKLELSNFGAGAGNSSTVTTASLAALLGITEATLSSAEFIAFDLNGFSNGSFENSTFRFADSANFIDATVTFTGGLLPPPQSVPGTLPVIAVGSLDEAAYGALFGYGPVAAGREVGWVLFDVSTPVDIYSATFKATITATNVDPSRPDVDAVARITQVPEPSTLLFGAIGIAGILCRRNRKSRND